MESLGLDMERADKEIAGGTRCEALAAAPSSVVVSGKRCPSAELGTFLFDWRSLSS